MTIYPYYFFIVQAIKIKCGSLVQVVQPLNVKDRRIVLALANSLINELELPQIDSRLPNGLVTASGPDMERPTSVLMTEGPGHDIIRELI
jgi:hypothetical protein